ncbi:TIGR00730 family Rossman fold protein [Eubacteriales bacterium OttesenSCG-928-K08]|nr:TIGR00730 family Rossman fold protein [Eubacteriales bacterium OttesenSCG-928-K08]
MQRKNICVFASSSQRLEEKYYTFAHELGAALAKEGLSLVFGGGRLGLMGACATGALENDGYVIGVIPELLNRPGIPHPGCHELIETPTMHERKYTMEDLSEAFITLPGGFGTFEELLEVITLRQLGYHNKPIVICNPFGFFDPLLEQFERMFEQNFANEQSRALYSVATTANDAVQLALEQKQLNLPDKMEDSLKP